MFGLLSVNGYILACGCSVLVAVAMYFWITRFPNYQEVSQDEIDQAEAMYEEIKQAQASQEKTVEIVIVNGQGKAVKVTLEPQQWENFKEFHSSTRETLSRQSLN